MDGRRWRRGGRHGAAGALAIALEVPKLCCVLLAKLLPGPLYHEKQKFAVKAKVNAAAAAATTMKLGIKNSIKIDLFVSIKSQGEGLKT